MDRIGLGCEDRFLALDNIPFPFGVLFFIGGQLIVVGDIGQGVQGFVRVLLLVIVRYGVRRSLIALLQLGSTQIHFIVS